jgi:hypothetical protein
MLKRVDPNCDKDDSIEDLSRFLRFTDSGLKGRQITRGCRRKREEQCSLRPVKLHNKTDRSNG